MKIRTYLFLSNNYTFDFNETIKINEDKLFQFNVLLNSRIVVETNSRLYICLNRDNSASRSRSSFSLDQMIVAKTIENISRHS